VNTDDPRHVSVILSKYGIGDTRGVCLGRCLAEIKHLDCLGLSDNRLTSISLPTIIENISYGTLLALDLSFNNMHGTGMQALASYFKAKTVLQDIDLSNCGLVCSDIKILCTVLSMYTNHLEEVRLSCNSIGEEGAHGEFLCRHEYCGALRRFCIDNIDYDALQFAHLGRVSMM
jgi:Ran GTPase-activating protein (RanGAP) involved in mRNA processing and transport